jgi:Rod binding domain-containing protein
MVSSISPGGIIPGATTTSLTQQPKLVNAAHEFEASMMKELLKPLQEDSLSKDDDGGEGLGSHNDALSDFASETLGRALSERGGFGIANKILDQIGSKGVGKSTTSGKNTLPLQGANS